MEQLITLFLMNLRTKLDEKFSAQGRDSIQRGQKGLSDSQFEMIITDFGRLTMEEVKSLLSTLFVDTDSAFKSMNSLQDKIVNSVTFSGGLGEYADIRMNTGTAAIIEGAVRIAQGPDNLLDPEKERGQNQNQDSGNLGQDIPSGPFDPGAENPSGGIDKIDPTKITGETLPEGITEKVIQGILQKYRNLEMDEEDRKLFRAWYDQFFQEIAGLFPKEINVMGLDGQMKTITGAEAALWTAMVAADQKVVEQKGQVDPDTGGLVKPPPENSIKVTVMSQQALPDGTVSSVPQDVFIQVSPEQFQLLLGSSFVNRLAEIGIAGDDSYPLISVYAGAWQDFRDALRNPSMLGIGEVDTAEMAELYMKINGEVDKYNPINPRDEQLPLLSEELIKTGITYAMDPVTKTMKLIDTMPWVGPSPASLTWIPRDPNDPTGVGSWSIDESMEMSIGKSLDEGVPASVRPWLQAVLNAGGDLSVIDQAFPEDALNDDFAQKQIQIIRHWVGYIMGQARIASDPAYAKQPVQIPRGAGMPPIDINAFDVAYPGFVRSSHGWEDLGLGSRAGIVKEAAQTLGVGANWREQWAKAQATGQLGSKGRYGGFPNMYADIDGNAQIGNKAVTPLDDILTKASNSITGTTGSTTVGTVERGDTYFDTSLGRWQGGWEGRDWGDTANDPWTTYDWQSVGDNTDEATKWKEWVAGLVASRMSAKKEIERLLAEDPNAFIPEGLRKQAEGYITDSARAFGQRLYDAWQTSIAEVPPEETTTPAGKGPETKKTATTTDTTTTTDSGVVDPLQFLNPQPTATGDNFKSYAETYEQSTKPLMSTTDPFGAQGVTGLSSATKDDIISQSQNIIQQSKNAQSQNKYNEYLDQQFADFMGAGNNGATTTNTTGMSGAANTVNIGNTASATAAAQAKIDAAAAAEQAKKDEEELKRILAMGG